MLKKKKKKGSPGFSDSEWKGSVKPRGGCVQIRTTRTRRPSPNPQLGMEAPSSDAAEGPARLGLGAERGSAPVFSHPILGEGEKWEQRPVLWVCSWTLEGLEAPRPPGSGGPERPEGLYRDRAFWWQ